MQGKKTDASPVDEMIKPKESKMAVKRSKKHEPNSEGIDQHKRMAMGEKIDLKDGFKKGGVAKKKAASKKK